MGEYVRPVEAGKGGEGQQVRPPEVAPLSTPSDGSDYAGQALGAALAQARVSMKPQDRPPTHDQPGPTPAPESSPMPKPLCVLPPLKHPGPIAQLRAVAQGVTEKAAEGLRSLGAAAQTVEQDLQEAAGRGLSQLKQHLLDNFTTHYRPSGPEAEVQRAGQEKAWAKVQESASKAPAKSPAGPENAPPPLETKDLVPQPFVGSPDRSQEQKRQKEHDRTR
ncbi:hypothetical protein [Methylacidimicrobium sp. B4]|uniref:hypothetical protein n=1 Tax=Methylacidimicrobium sp. B4 TaxID=2796139 RepID=UPI001A9028D2|nr:hypothetical protein [Methylacidimicrobium sp. B4]QSR85023.1 hypothetical protein MacB4_01775 [Methylacidimicrobium sp. B4]